MAPNEKTATLERGGLLEIVRTHAELAKDKASDQAKQARVRSAVARRFVGAVPFAGGEVRVTIAPVKGVPSIDMREFRPFVAHAPKLMAAGQGVSFPVGRAIELAAMLVEADDQARAMGLMGDGE